jgi:hypothetical protein
MAPLELKEAVTLLKSGNWLHVRCITADVQKGSGGTVLELPKVRLSQRYSNPLQTKLSANVISKKQPKHHTHFTLNMELPNKLIRKIHPALVTHINQVPVL